MPTSESTTSTVVLGLESNSRFVSSVLVASSKICFASLALRTYRRCFVGMITVFSWVSN